MRWPLCVATARILPYEARTATTAADPRSGETAPSAAAWAAASMVVRTGLPSDPRQLFSTDTWRPAAFSATTSVVGVPTRDRWYASSSPDRPTVVPGR